MRDIFPCNFLRAELLKAIKYPDAYSDESAMLFRGKAPPCSE
jgi:hypothetical protein